jgi:hypothetical protein
MSDWDRFANGITAPRKRVCDCQDSEPPRPEHSDAKADRTFNIPSAPGPAGAPPNAVYKRWR